MVPPRPQQFVVHLSPELARRAMEEVGSPESPYESFSEFVAVAVENQLALKAFADEPAGPRARSVARPAKTNRRARIAEHREFASSGDATVSRGAVDTDGVATTSDLLARPQSTEVPTHATPGVTDEALTPFTNRLNPLAAGLRVLVNMTLLAGPPELDIFVQTAAVQTREFGLRLREEDVRDGRRGRHRRWTAWPVGDDDVKSLARFRKSFLMSRNGKAADGPMVQLGLAAGVDGVAYPTRAGVELATAVIPAIDGGGVELLGEDQRDVLARQLLALPAERREIAAFLDAIDQSDGIQDDVDKRVAHAHNHWTEAQVVSHRAAMLGRLRDLEVLDVDAETENGTRLLSGPGADQFKSLLAQLVDDRA